MAIARQFNDLLDVSGLADFKGTVRGNGDNPYLTLLLSAVGQGDRLGEHFKGTLFKQPYDSIKLTAAGNVDEIHIDDFALEKDGALKWTVIEGTVGLTGNKSINLKLDTAVLAGEEKMRGDGVPLRCLKDLQKVLEGVEERRMLK